MDVLFLIQFPLAADFSNASHSFIPLLLFPPLFMRPLLYWYIFYFISVSLPLPFFARILEAYILYLHTCHFNCGAPDSTRSIRTSQSRGLSFNTGEDGDGSRAREWNRLATFYLFHPILISSLPHHMTTINLAAIVIAPLTMYCTFCKSDAIHWISKKFSYYTFFHSLRAQRTNHNSNEEILKHREVLFINCMN